MISIKEVYDMVNDLSDKNNGRYLTDSEFTRYAITSSDELFDEFIGATNRNLNKQTNVAYGRSQDTDLRLEPFKESKTIVVTDGEAILPPDCAKIRNVLKSKTTRVALKRLDDDREGMIFGNPLREPDEDDIYYIEGKKVIEVFGNTGSVYVKYFRKPISPKYATKDVEIQVGNRTVIRKEYDSANSVDFDWDNRQMLDLVTRILQKAGIPMKDQFIEQMVNVNKNNE